MPLQKHIDAEVGCRVIVLLSEPVIQHCVIHCEKDFCNCGLLLQLVFSAPLTLFMLIRSIKILRGKKKNNLQRQWVALELKRGL